VRPIQQRLQNAVKAVLLLLLLLLLLRLLLWLLVMPCASEATFAKGLSSYLVTWL
jgi:hypothetical protein